MQARIEIRPVVVFEFENHDHALVREALSEYIRESGQVTEFESIRLSDIVRGMEEIENQLNDALLAIPERYRY